MGESNPHHDVPKVKKKRKKLHNQFVLTVTEVETVCKWTSIQSPLGVSQECTVHSATQVRLRRHMLRNTAALSIRLSTIAEI